MVRVRKCKHLLQDVLLKQKPAYELRQCLEFRRVLFLFQAEDGIRDWSVTGVQTCALPISSRRRHTRLVSDWSSDVCSSDLLGLAQGSFWRGRIASEALGVLLVLVGVLAALALASYDPRDPNLFSITAGGEAASPTNWIGGFGANVAFGLYQLIGFAAWGVAILLLLWGSRMFLQRPVENPATKAAGFALLFLSVPTLLSLGFGRRPLFGEDAEAGGVVGKAFAEAARGGLGPTGRGLTPLRSRPHARRP